MKKRIWQLILSIAIVVAAGWNIHQNRSEVELSEFAIENVEALAGGETGGSGECQWATRQTSGGWEAICIRTGVGYNCTCGDVKPYY
ncbi:MAG: NVEALA domain-containing protein [Tannerella sp.]|jgi:hypothetical protein|nr:NVEALA domain-containing protein [Tannerella sp.]